MTGTTPQNETTQFQSRRLTQHLNPNRFEKVDCIFRDEESGGHPDVRNFDANG